VGSGTRPEPSPLEVQRDVHEREQHRHLDQRADNRRERDAGADAEHRDRDRDREFEVVRRRGEPDRGRGRVVGADAAAHPEAHEEHHHEVDRERDGDQQHVSGRGNDPATLGCEHHDNGEKQRDQRERVDPGDELLVVPRFALHACADVPTEEAGRKRDAEEDHDRLEHLRRGDIEAGDPDSIPRSGGTKSAKNQT